MKVLLTGAAGFIGSTLARRLLDEGHEVVGVDSFTDYYDVGAKRSNVAGLHGDPAFELVESDILAIDANALVDDADAVVHLAGQPGVRLSWADHFDTYLSRNVLSTQRLLEALRSRPEVPLLFASSSSVYGNAVQYPCSESDPLRPLSPYGVTKAAAEQLSYSYATQHDLRVVAMRFFTVYGPRQRPDMATQRLVDAALRGTTFQLFGDGTQRRDFTYVDDIVRAVHLLLESDIPQGLTPLNLGGNGDTSMNRLIEIVEDAAGVPIDVRRTERQAGDAMRTGADTTLAREWLGWNADVDLEVGVFNQVEHTRAALRAASVSPLTSN